jgi:hypothetical protein
MAAWRGVFGKLKWLLVVGTILIAVVVGAYIAPFDVRAALAAVIEVGGEQAMLQEGIRLPSAEDAEREARRRQWDERRRKRQAENAAHDERRKRLVRETEARLAKEPPRKRRVRRYPWQSPGSTLGEILDVPEENNAEATLVALVRVFLSEADGHPRDNVGVYQVVKNIRSRTCDRGRIRKITQCDENGETLLSALRRAQPHILAVTGYKLRNARAGWIRNQGLDCENPPRGWRRSENEWDAQYGSKTCPQTVEAARYLVKGELPPSRPGARARWLPGAPIAWGGRCENKRASCDDRMACARGLIRLDTKTHNAFWRKAGPGEIEPICAEHGYAPAPEDPEPQEVGQVVETNEMNEVSTISESSGEPDENS